VLEEPTTCRSGQPTLDGSKFSNMRTANSSTGRTAKSLMLKAERILKANQLEFGATIEENTSNGKLSILIKTRVKLRRE
jgi:hypothetical protein